MEGKPTVSSEFERIINLFENELDSFNNLSSSILNKACKLKNFKEPIEQGENEKVNPDGIIEKLHERISHMSKLNNRLKFINDGLIDIIGE